jgi:hypothetical protein
MKKAVVPRSLAVVVVVATAAPVASGMGAVGRWSSISPQLVGNWTRTVSRADVKRSGATGIPAGSVWTLKIKKDGTASVFGTKGVGSFDGTVTSTGADRVQINLGIASANAYVWHVSKQLLTLTKVKDPIQDRVAVFVGTWKQR